MRNLLLTVGTSAAALLLVALVVFGAHDTSTFVPVPEAVAEGFARQIGTRRFELALNYLASGTRRVETPMTLEARFRSISSEMGRINQVSAEPLWASRDRAAARATVESDAGRKSFDVTFVRENGLWRIADLPDLVR